MPDEKALPAPAPKRVTSVDVARLAGVSQAAVSRTYTLGASISKQTRERVLKAAATLGYTPNKLPTLLHGDKTGIIAIVAGPLSTPFQSATLDLLAGKLSSSGRFVKFVSAPSDQIFDDVASDLKSYRVDAVIATLGIESAEAVQALDDMKVPVVRFASGPSGTFIRTVTTDNYSVGWQAAELMVEGGRQSFAFIAGTGSSSQDLRATGFETRLKQTGLPYRRIIAPGHDYQAGRASVQSLLSQCPVDGLMCGNDNVACGVIDELRLKGFDLPGDMSVVGCDDIEQASWSAFKLTSFRQRLDLMTDKAIALLEGPLPEEHEFLFAPELVRRASG